MKIKDRNMIDTLLKLIMMENDGLTLDEVESMLDTLMLNKEAFPLFTPPSQTSEGTMTWYLEEDQQVKLKGLHDNIRKLMADSNRITILLSPQCDQCDGMMSKFKSEAGVFSFRCDSCQITHTFKLVQESKTDEFDG